MSRIKLDSGAALALLTILFYRLLSTTSFTSQFPTPSSHFYLYFPTLEAVPNGLTLSICFVKAERPLCSPFYLAVGLVGNVPHSIKVKAFLRLSSVCCNRIALHGKESILEVIITFHGVYPQCVKKVGSKGMESLPSFPTVPCEKRLS